MVDESGQREEQMQNSEAEVSQGTCDIQRGKENGRTESDMGVGRQERRSWPGLVHIPASCHVAAVSPAPLV